MENRISVKKYLENKEDLELIYVPHSKKVDVCKLIIEQCASHDKGYNSLDSVLLDRVKTEIFLEAITNLDLTDVDENGLEGYDQLCMYDELDELIEECGYLYYQFDYMLDMMVYDYNHNEASLKGWLNNLKTTIVEKVTLWRERTTEYIENLDAKEIADKITGMINEYNNGNK